MQTSLHPRSKTIERKLAPITQELHNNGVKYKWGFPKKRIILWRNKIYPVASVEAGLRLLRAWNLSTPPDLTENASSARWMPMDWKWLYAHGEESTPWGSLLSSTNSRPLYGTLCRCNLISLLVTCPDRHECFTPISVETTKVVPVFLQDYFCTCCCPCYFPTPASPPAESRDLHTLLCFQLILTYANSPKGGHIVHPATGHIMSWLANILIFIND